MVLGSRTFTIMAFLLGHLLLSLLVRSKSLLLALHTHLPHKAFWLSLLLYAKCIQEAHASVQPFKGGPWSVFRNRKIGSPILMLM